MVHQRLRRALSYCSNAISEESNVTGIKRIATEISTEKNCTTTYFSSALSLWCLRYFVIMASVNV